MHLLEASKQTATHQGTRSGLFVALLPVLCAASGCSGTTESPSTKDTPEAAMTVPVRSGVLVVGNVHAPGSSANPGEPRRQPVTDAVGYLAPTMAIKVQPPKEVITVRVKDGRLEPPFPALVVGQTLIVQVVDKRQHALMIDPSNAPAVTVIPPGDPNRLEHVFRKPDDAAMIKCNINPEVYAHLTVVPNQVFTRSGKDGSFQLPSTLPPGNYELRAYHPKYGRAVATAQLRPTDAEVSVELLLPPPR